MSRVCNKRKSSFLTRYNFRVANKKKIGIFGGTFDPPHNGHLSLLRHVIKELSLDKVIVTVANEPWQKTSSRRITDRDHRFNMTKLLFEECDNVIVSDIEFRIGGETSTAKTLDELRLEYPADEFWLILGLDSAVNFDTWRRPQSIVKEARVVIVNRPGYTEESVPPILSSAVSVKGIDIDISSAKIRGMFATKGDLSGLIPNSIEIYVLQNDLYGQ